MDAEYIIHEGHRITVYADVELDIEPATGDGWNEPREEARATVISATLRQVELKTRLINDASLPLYLRIDRTPEVVTTDLGPAPEWVLRLIERDTDWLSEQCVDDNDDSDYRRDSRIDLELSER